MRNSIRQLIALASMCLLATVAQAQFQNLYDYVNGNTKQGGIYKDVQCIENVGQDNVAIVTVGSDNLAPPDGLFAFHDVNGVPLNYLRLANPNGHLVDAQALCSTPSGNLVGCFFDPVDLATDIVCVTTGGAIVWTQRLAGVRMRDCHAGLVGIAGAERVFFTGNTVVPGAPSEVAAASLNGATGGVVWFNRYTFPAPYTNTAGFEILFQNLGGRLTLAGKTAITQCATGVVAMRLVVGTGAVNWTKVYHAPNCNYEMVGKTLVNRPGVNNEYVVGFDYRDPAGAWPGVLRFDNFGNLLQAKYFTGAGFWGGNGYAIDGLDHNGQDFMLSGAFVNGTTVQISAFTLSVTNALVGTQLNEYELGSAYPPAETKFVDLDYYNATNQFVMGGHFRSAPGAAAWPLWPTDVAFWLVASDNLGNSVCTTNQVPVEVVLNPSQPDPAAQPLPLQQGQYYLVNDNPTPEWFPECDGGPGNPGGNDKTGFGQQLDAPLQPTFTYSDASKQIIARVPADIQGSMSLRMIDMQGRVLTQVSLTAGEHRIDASQLSTGIYFLRFEAAGLNAGTQKVLVR